MKGVGVGGEVDRFGMTRKFRGTSVVKETHRRGDEENPIFSKRDKGVGDRNKWWERCSMTLGK